MGSGRGGGEEDKPSCSMDSPPDAALRTSDFEYDLPTDLIAQFPSAVRGESRLLAVRRAGDGTGEGLRDLTFADFPSLVAPGDLLVFNSTRVRHARLIGRRPSGAPAEVLLIHPADDGWIAMGKPGSALLPGKRIELDRGLAVETLEVLEDGYRKVRFLGGTAEEAMARFGRLPLPPYLDREPTPEDEVRYQTVLAEQEGSVAAPTAGLHFTAELLAALCARGAHVVCLDLEVGPGTFRPIEVADFRQHAMHAERYHIPESVSREVGEARSRTSPVWAIGTTVVRALEAAATPEGAVRAGPGQTNLMIAPGYEFRVVDKLVTNFHLPRSSLLLLVAAFAGYRTIRAAYRHAIQHQYRFYSYGDAMAIS